MRRRRNAPLSATEVAALKSILGSHGVQTNPRRKKRKARKVRRVRKIRRVKHVRRVVRKARVVHKTIRRGIYRYRVMVTKGEREIITQARKGRMSKLLEAKRLKRLPPPPPMSQMQEFRAAAGQYGIALDNPRGYSGMWLSKGERDMVKSARSARMRGLSLRRRGGSSLEDYDKGYGEYTLDNPIVGRGAKRILVIGNKRIKIGKRKTRRVKARKLPKRLAKFKFKANDPRTAKMRAKARAGWLRWFKKTPYERTLGPKALAAYRRNKRKG